MEFEFWHIWLIVTFICFIMEIFIPSFILFNFGIGAVVGSAAAGLGLSIEWQIALFSVGTLISFFTIRPFIREFAYKRSHDVTTNVDAMIGKQAKVIEAIDNLNNQGRIMLDGDVWQARSENDELIPTDSIVEVIQVRSIILIVKSNK